MSVSKINQNNIPNELLDEINRSKIFGMVSNNDLTIKNMKEYSMIAVYRKHIYERDLQEATKMYKKMFKM